MEKKWSATLVSIFILMQMPTHAEEVITVSPDSKITFGITHNDEGIFYELKVNGQEILKRSPISISIDGRNYPGNALIKTVIKQTINAEIIPIVPIITSRIDESCNEMLLQFDAPVALRVRAYNDGVAFRWESQINKEEVVVDSEQLDFNFAEDFGVYYPIPNGNDFFSHQENEFVFKKISQTPDLKTGCVPALFDLGSQHYLLLTDVNVEGYPGLWIKGVGHTKVEAVFPHYPAKIELNGDRDLKVSEYSDFLAKTAGTRSYPWRALVIASAENLLTSTMLYTLAEPCRLSDTSWIKPGKVAWDWWNAWNITDVEFEAGINQKTYKNYIDFAAENNLQYIILDEGWSTPGPDNLLNVIPDLNIGELVQYAHAKNVGVLLWMTSAALERNFDKAFEQFSEWGIKGLKVDFMQRDDQMMMDFCSKVAQEAAKHKLLVDFHGGSKPTGLQRTYPNVLTHESVLGLEQSKWNRKASPPMAVLLPFIRMAVGPMDYTPGAMDNFTDAQFHAEYNNPESLGTRCHQLAMYVAYLSPLQMLADTPTKYRKNPECMPFLQSVPVTWEETVVLKAEVGKVLALARRNGNTWYLCAMTDWEPRELSLKLDFLGRGKHRLRYWADGPSAAENATDTSIGELSVAAGSKLKIKLAPGGGYAAILEPYTKSADKD